MPRIFTVRGTDDYLTMRAANPRTGCISPSVFTSRNGSITPRTPGTPAEALALYSTVQNDDDILALSTLMKRRLRPWRGVNAGTWWDSRMVEVERRDSDITMMHDEGTESKSCMGSVSPTSLDEHGDHEDRFIVPMPSAQEPQPYGPQRSNISKPMAFGYAADLHHGTAYASHPISHEVINPATSVVDKTIATSDGCLPTLHRSAPAPYRPSASLGTRIYTNLRQLPRVDLVHPSRAGLPRARGFPKSLASYANEKHIPSEVNTEPNMKNSTITVLPHLMQCAYILGTISMAHIREVMSGFFAETTLRTIFDSSIPGDLRWRRLTDLLSMMARAVILFYAIFCIWKMVAAISHVFEIIIMPVRTVLKIVGWLLRL